ncbi:unnamed protein product [Cochlearia groenlandica]
MGQSCFYKALLVSSLLLLIFFSTGTKRKTMELMDYEAPGSNTNWNGFVASPPPQSPPPLSL